MNRPKLKDYFTETLFTHEDDYKEYTEDLEKYCDFLEEENKCYGEVYSECEQLRKALDKACDVLADEIRTCCKPTTYLSKECGECKKCWKEYLLNDKR